MLRANAAMTVLGVFALIGMQQPAAADHRQYRGDRFFGYDSNSDADCQEIHGRVVCFGPRFRRFDEDNSYVGDDDYTNCDEAKDIVREEGFRKVRLIACGGRYHVFSARRDGIRYQVKVNRRSGELRLGRLRSDY